MEMVGRSWNPMVTSLRTGVALLLVVVSVALYFRYRFPLNWASEAPLPNVVPAVPSEPTNENGPSGLSLAAACIVTAVEAGVVCDHDSVSHSGDDPGAGLASFADDTNVPGDVKPPATWVTKPRSRRAPSADHDPPLVEETTLEPAAYGLLSGVQLQTYAYTPADGFDTARMTIAYVVPAVMAGGVAKVNGKY